MRTSLFSSLVVATAALFAAACSAGTETATAESATSPLTHASPTTFIVNATVSKTTHGEVLTSVGVGFHDSSFDSDTKSFCFVGQKGDVCGLVQDYAKQMQGEYASGAHDTIEVKTFALDANGEVTVTYHLSDDYRGDIDVAKTIEECDSDKVPTSALGTRILEAEGWAPDQKPHTVWAMVGFHDSSFDDDAKSFCYLGDVAGACASIEASAAAMHDAYGGGAHDDIQLKSCAAKDGKVTVSYHLDDDYGGDVDRTRTLEACYVWGADEAKP